MICARRHCWSWREGWCFSLQLPGDTGIFHVAKNLPSFAWPPSSLYSLLWWRLHRALTCPAGVLCALLYRCGRSPCLRLQRNAATARYQTMKPGSFWRHASTSQTVSWGSERTSPGVRKAKPKMCQSCWEFSSSCSVGVLWLSWGSIFVSSCCLVVGVSSVVDVKSPSLVSSFTVIVGGNKTLKESIRRWVFFSDFPPTADLLDGLSTVLHCFIATTWLGSIEAPSIMVKNVHTWTIGLLWKLSCLKQIVLVAWHNHTVYKLRRLFTNIRINTKNIARLNKQSNQQGISLGQSRHPRLPRLTPFCLRFHCFKELHQVGHYNNILLRNNYYAYYYSRTPLLCLNRFLPNDVIMLHSKFTVMVSS